MPTNPTPEQERAAIVAWLRDIARVKRSLVKMGLPGVSPTIAKHDAAHEEELADQIERGDHHRSKTDGE